MDGTKNNIKRKRKSATPELVAALARIVNHLNGDPSELTIADKTILATVEALHKELAKLDVNPVNENKRRRWREQKKRQRGRKGMACEQQEHSPAPAPAVIMVTGHDERLASMEELMRRRRADAPTLEMVMNAASMFSPPIPPGYAESFYQEMQACGFCFRTHGKDNYLNKFNYRRILKSFWNNSPEGRAAMGLKGAAPCDFE